MSMATLETAVLAELIMLTGNSKLKKKDMLEWSTGDIKPQEDEQVWNLPGMGVNVVIKK